MFVSPLVSIGGLFDNDPMRNPWEIDGFLENKNGVLHIDGVSAVEIAARHKTPVFVFSRKRIAGNITRLLSIGDVIDCTLKVCYAAKANSEHGILNVIREAGSDIEVNSGGELKMALAAGFAGDQIIFNGNSKTEEEIADAVKGGIYAIQSDSFYELELTESVARKLGTRANVSLRLVPEIKSDTLHGLQTALLTSKFGMMPQEALDAFHRWKPDDPHMNLCGIHIHIGSQNPSGEPYKEAMLALFRNLARIHDETGHKPSHINIGGGFPVNYLRDDSHAEFMSREQVALLSADLEPREIIRNAWTAVVEAAVAADARHLIENIELLIEPGRAIIGDAAVCLTRVRNKKKRPLAGSGSEYKVQSAKLVKHDSEASISDPEDSETDLEHVTPNPEPSLETWLMTDAGFNILLSMETYKWYYHLISAERADQPHDFPYKVAGPLCDGGDVYFDIEGHRRLPDHRFLPKEVEPGELLALLNTGAYSVSQMYPYNGRELPEIVLI